MSSPGEGHKGCGWKSSHPGGQAGKAHDQQLVQGSLALACLNAFGISDGSLVVPPGPFNIPVALLWAFSCPGRCVEHSSDPLSPSSFVT